ncbi:hypothetical protein [Croceimicrobium hydrocarbonivorans]|uniref:Lipoprotein n=1 Tax=Croceimicrobium hydrocarbonivorans TaxID=2761580 RepID=A0A7H0VDP9_9FLAO|nr:hypothetical protein [Croceimicrobium hydrocarbonivorans]QNR23847.1 hypothetical protein H4K34_15945 [Croceimicrobium hydrocarbonivorans]
MKIRSLISVLGFIYALTACEGSTQKDTDYRIYHARIIEAEELISQENYQAALTQYEDLFADYDFIFLRDYKIAAQISFLIGDKEKGLLYLKKAIANGWEWTEFKEHKFLNQHLLAADWKSIEDQYEDLRSQFLNRIDVSLRARVQAMFEKDQELAYEAYIIEDEQEQEKFIAENFPRHSEVQLAKLLEILETKGYPGEYLIGNDFWVSTILSHHNSQGLEYVKTDSLFDFIKPKLKQYLKLGYISPYEMALPEDWKGTILSEGEDSPYGYLVPPKRSNISRINKARNAIGLGSVELRNKLIAIEAKTGISLYLPDWVEGKIEIKGN